MVPALTLFTFLVFVTIELISRKIKARRKKSLHVDTNTGKPYLPISELFQNIQINLPKGLFVSKGHVWVKVHWKYNIRTSSYVWVKAKWVKVRKRHTYVAGHWKAVPGGYKWVSGHWRRV